MLRITRGPESAGSILFRVEGRIVSEWADLMVTELSEALRSEKGVRMDLSGVEYIDRNGAAALRSMVAKGVRIEGLTPFVSELLASE